MLSQNASSVGLRLAEKFVKFYTCYFNVCRYNVYQEDIRGYHRMTVGESADVSLFGGFSSNLVYNWLV